MDIKEKAVDPDFTTLTGIMEYYHTVPFETFKNKLAIWFEQSVAERGYNISKEEREKLIIKVRHVVDLIDKIWVEKHQSTFN